MIIVTGHMGFVGMHLLLALSQHHKNEPEQFVRGIDLKVGDDILDCPLPTNVDRVYHLAANVDAIGEDLESMMRMNVLGTARLLDRYGSSLILASSSMVNYPVTPYAISKLACEHMATACGAAVVRLCNLYGDGGHSVIDRFASDDAITINGSGEQRRTYAPVQDAVDALIAARPGETKVLYGVEYSINDIAGYHPGKPVHRVPAHQLDILGGVQI